MLVSFYFIMKKIITFFVCLLNFSVLFCLPGVKSEIKDLSGQYVYYKDSSFERESYFGILYYDEGTYCLRYYAPSYKTGKTTFPRKDIQILFSLNTEVKYVELIGEKIITSVTPEDTHLINYLHDLLYELTARRQKAGKITNKTSVPQVYEQFGGNVTINFDPLIPIFNIKDISMPDNSTPFKIVTAGQLLSSSDKSFSDFSGFPTKITDKKHNLKIKNVNKNEFSYKKNDKITQKIVLDSLWKQNAENLFTLDNNAVLALDVIETNEINNTINSLSRKFILGTDYSYPNYDLLKIREINNTHFFSNTYFNTLSNTYTIDYKILTQIDNKHLGILTLSVFYGAHKGNQKYFENILSEYSVSIKN